MTADPQFPNASAGVPDAPLWQPMGAPAAETADQPAALAAAASDAENAPADAVSDADSAASSVEFAPGYTRKSRAKAGASRRAGSTTALLMAGALVAVGGLGFAVGHNLTSGSAGDAQTNGLPGAGNFLGGEGRPDGSFVPGAGLGRADSSTVSGTVESVTSDSMTVKLANGQTVTVALGSTTTYHSQTTAGSSSVTTGSTVIVQTANDAPNAAATNGTAASPGTDATSRTATDVTVTSK
jgi:hypothetical protein